MSYKEAFSWAMAAAMILAVGTYVATVGPRLAQGPVSEVAYRGPMLLAVAVLVAGSIAGAIVAAAGTALAARRSGGSPADAVARADERDRRIEQRGRIVGSYVLSALVVAALAMLMLGAHAFWVANALFAGLFLAEIGSAAARIVAYRTGI